MNTFNPKPYYQNYIDGKFVDGGSGKITVDNPATGEPLAQQAIASSEDVDNAISAARRCHESRVLTQMRPVERGRMVKAIGD
ncbi:MAG: aldehyde dehydrogenase family protein, partial [Proteobacteria bacterium]